MRFTFIDVLSQLARQDDKVMLIVGDVGFSYIEDFAAEFPGRFINAGVTEQSMMGMAAGLAMMGMKPYVYSMIPFVTMRCFEQLRNDVCYNNANVKIIGVKGSEHYKFLGFSHNITPNEDKHILAEMPNLVVAIPNNERELAAEMMHGYTEQYPQYLRI
jgi:transketolase